MQYLHTCSFKVSFLFQTVVLLLISLTTANAIEFTSEEQTYIKRGDVVRVHNETDWPPFNFNSNGQPQGISIDVMKRVAEITGLQIEFVSGPSWDEFMNMMVSGQLDVMLNIIDLPERH